MLTPHRQAFVDAASIAFELAARPQVAAAWESESTCAGMSVGGLAHHLVRQVVLAAELLDAEPGSPPIALLEHYGRAAWVKGGHDDPANVGVRTRSDEQAAVGPEAVLAEARAALDRVPGLLDRVRDPDSVLIPWQHWSLTTDDLVTTRLMELVVHSDDLAASVDLPTPEFPESALTPVLGLLTGVAVRRHGQAAVVRALSRPQRAPEHVSAF
jgi:hypothetical protein